MIENCWHQPSLVYTDLINKFIGDFVMQAIIAISATILIMVIMLIGAMMVYKMSGAKDDGSSEE